MPVLVDHAERPLVMDTLPVIKLTHWYGTPGHDTVYAYARLCICDGALKIAMTVFDGRPPVTQRAHAILQLAGVQLHLTFAPDGSVLLNGRPLPDGNRLFSAGEDEQGWYWQTLVTLPAPQLQALGCGLPIPGSSFMGGFTLQDVYEEAFGSAFAAPDAAGPRPETCLENFLVIPA